MTKLIYTANARIPTEKAHGIQIMKMCEAFSAHGINVELILPWRLNKIKENPFNYYEVKKTFKIKKLPTLDFIALGLGRFGFFAETFLFLIASRIYLLFKNYDILYTREERAGLFFNNFCVEIHFLPARPSFLHKITWRKAKAIFVLTSFIKNELVGLGVVENKILVLPDAVDLAKFDIKISKEEARKKLNLPQDKKIILYTGSFYLYDWKGVDILLKAAEEFGTDFLFLLVGGNGEEIGEIKNKFKKENILLLGHKPYAEIPYYLKSADVLALPNKKGEKISEEHTSPLKLFEYMASGRTIVASDLPSLREILTEKEAIFFKPNDQKDLALKIKDILASPVLAEQLAHNAREKVQGYTWPKRARHAIGFLTKQNYDVVLPFAFGFPDNLDANLKIKKRAKELSTKLEIPVFDEAKERTSSTLKFVKSFVVIAKEKNWREPLVVAAPSHEWRCLRDLRKCGFEADADGYFRNSGTNMYDQNSRQWWTRSSLLYLPREFFLRLLPWWIYEWLAMK